MLNNQTSRKINTFCEQFSLFQCINEPTHFTENSSTLLDILLVTNKDHLILCRVGDPFLHQEQRYHCPVYGVFNFCKPKLKHINDAFGDIMMEIMNYYDKKSQLQIGVFVITVILMFMHKTL